MKLMLSARQWWWLALAAFCWPLLILGVDIANANLGPDPVKAVHIRLGDWSLRLLCLTLTVTPLQTLTQWRGMADFRQLFGLLTWFYASLHVWVYLGVDQGWQWPLIAADMAESRYIWFGLLSYLILLLLALTSSVFAMRLLGRNWKRLHRYIYLAAPVAVLHYIWQLKGNLAVPAVYGLIVGGLLLFRVASWLQGRPKLGQFWPRWAGGRLIQPAKPR